jgi:hypothetical protein
VKGRNKTLNVDPGFFFFVDLFLGGTWGSFLITSIFPFKYKARIMVTESTTARGEKLVLKRLKGWRAHSKITGF